MSESKKLNKRQLAVLDDLFRGTSEEQAVLKKHRVPSVLYEKWLADEQFTRQFEQRIAGGYRQSRIILARSAPEATHKLVKLAKKKDGSETTRKACLDIITLQPPASHKTSSAAPPAAEPSAPAADLSPEAASRLLAALAGQT
jgi:hypothetical protein